jgi:cbb3-type cytochrome oxidase subunit 1
MDAALAKLRNEIPDNLAGRLPIKTKKLSVDGNYYQGFVQAFTIKIPAYIFMIAGGSVSAASRLCFPYHLSLTTICKTSF